MKGFKLFILFFFASFSSYSQKASVELTIEWQKERVYLKQIEDGQKEVLVPYLVITYRNISNEYITLKKATPDDYYLTNVSLIMFNTNMQYDERVMYLRDYSSNKYIYKLGGFIINEYSKNTEYSSPIIDSEIVSHIINSDLFNLYCVLTVQKELEVNGVNKQLRCFNYPDKDYITFKEAQNILFNYQKLDSEFDQVLTLEPNQVKKHRLSLLGYLAVKGTFIFKVTEDDIILHDFPNITFNDKIYKPLTKDEISTSSVQIEIK